MYVITANGVKVGEAATFAAADDHRTFVKSHLLPGTTVKVTKVADDPTLIAPSQDFGSESV